MSFKGMDPDALRASAHRLDSMAGALSHAHAQVGSHLRQVPWHGPVAERFNGNWFGPLRAQVLGASAQLAELAQALRREVEGQERASASGGGALGAAGARRGWSRALSRTPLAGVIGPGVVSGLGLAALLRGRGYLDVHSTGVGVGRDLTKTGKGKAHEKQLPGHAPTKAKAQPPRTHLDVSTGVTRGAMVGGNVHGQGSLGGVQTNGSAEALAYAQVQANGHVTADKDHLEVAAGASMAIVATAGIAGSVGSRDLGVSGRASVTARAQAEATVKASLSNKGAVVHGAFTAEAVASADASATAHLAGVDAGGTVHAYAGAGVHAKADAVITAKDVKFSVSAGAALGVGAGCDFSVDVKPDQVWQNVQHLGRTPAAAALHAALNPLNLSYF